MNNSEHFHFAMKSKLSRFDPFNYMNLAYLNLRGNALTSIDFIMHLPKLQFLDVGINQIATLGLVKSFDTSLKVLRIEGNLIKRMEEFIRLIELKHLVVEFGEHWNPLCDSIDYPNELIRFLELDSVDGFDLQGNSIATDILYGFAYFKKNPKKIDNKIEVGTQMECHNYSTSIQTELEVCDEQIQAELINPIVDAEINRLSLLNKAQQEQLKSLQSTNKELHSNLLTAKRELQLSRDSSQDTLNEFVNISQSIGTLNHSQKQQLDSAKKSYLDLQRTVSTKTKFLEKLETTVTLLKHNLKKQSSLNKSLADKNTAITCELQSIKLEHEELGRVHKTDLVALQRYEIEYQITDEKINKACRCATDIAHTAEKSIKEMKNKCKMAFRVFACFKLISNGMLKRLKPTVNPTIPDGSNTAPSSLPKLVQIVRQINASQLSKISQLQQDVDSQHAKTTVIKQNLENKISEFQLISNSLLKSENHISKLTRKLKGNVNSNKHLVEISEQLESELNSSAATISKLTKKLQKSKRGVAKLKIKQAKWDKAAHKTTTGQTVNEVHDLREKLDLLNNYNTLKSSIQSLHNKHEEREQSISAAVRLLSGNARY